MQLVDLFYPMVFALFVASSLALTISRLVPRHRALLALAALPFAAAAFDYVENAFAWLALTAFPEPAATNALLGLASAAKSTTSWAAGLLLLGTLAALAATSVTRRLRGRTGRRHGRPPLMARQDHGRRARGRQEPDRTGSHASTPGWTTCSSTSGWSPGPPPPSSTRRSERPGSTRTSSRSTRCWPRPRA